MADYLKAQDLTDSFLSTPGSTIVNRLLFQLSRIKAMEKLFGPYRVVEKTERATDQQRWADYQRLDWSIRQLPAMNVFEGQTEAQSSDEGYLTGTVSVQVYWPPNFRRSDAARIPAVFKGVMQNFFSSQYASDMLDEHYSIKREAKVPGLNELGKTLSWSPNIEGIIESEAVPVTILDVGYRIDLRAWHRALESDHRTKQNPFERTVADLDTIAGLYLGVETAEPLVPIVTVAQTIKF